MRFPYPAPWAVVLLCLLWGGCSDDDKVLGGHDDEEEDLNTWIWALDDQSGTIRIHDADTGALEATLAGSSHPMMRQILAGPESEPTVWMGRDGTAYGFTRGFAPHGDHTHMEIPAAIAVLATGPGTAHQGVDSHGEIVVYANDGDSTFTLIDVAARTASTLHHGSGHSAAFYAHGRLVATDMHAPWARGIDAAGDTILFQATIDTLAHGDAYHHESETLFIATLKGFETLDPGSGSLGARIPYPAPGRVNFLYHAGETSVAFGPHKTGSTTDKIFLLDMEQRTAEVLAISGATLDWSVSGGAFALSADGRMVVAADLAQARLYMVCIDSENASCYRSVTTLAVPATGMACAVNHAGDHVWALDQATGTVYCYHPTEGELHNSWSTDPSTDYIFATSVAPSIDVLKDF